MKDQIKIRKEFRLVNDMLDIIDIKIYNLVGALEVISLGIGAVSNTDDSYEISSVNVLKEYLSMVHGTDIAELHERLKSLEDCI